MKDQELLELYNKYLSYNPETGVLTWKIRTASCVRIGGRAGTLIKKGYRQIRLKGISYKEHRIAFLMYHGYMPEYIDHTNRIKNDNRILNLRGCTAFENSINRGYQKNSKSKIKGVCWNRFQDKWMAYINYKTKRIHLGYFIEKLEAVKAYNDASLKYHGDLGYINKIKDLD